MRPLPLSLHMFVSIGTVDVYIIFRYMKNN